MRDDYQIEGVAFSLKEESGRFGDGARGRLEAGATKKSADEGGGVDRQGTAVGQAGARPGEAPLALRHPVEHVIHGDRRVDHYAWMKEKKNPQVREYLEAENTYTNEMLRGTEGLQEKLYQEMLGRIQQTDLSVPYLLRGYEYYTRTVEGQQYPIYCRRPARLANGPTLGAKMAPGAPSEVVIGHQIADISRNEEEVLLDLNAMASGNSYMGLGIFEISDDNGLLAYATDTTGYRQYVLEVKRLKAVAIDEWRVASHQTLDLSRSVDPADRGRGGAAPLQNASLKGDRGTKAAQEAPGRLPFRAERVTSAAWSADGRFLFYVTEDEVTKRSNQLWRHEMKGGSPGALLYEEK
ncbi:MAG TPA: hypothetical protein VN203_26995, partial [Candidatus Acidoferrum sp.]|nr:hypothetical protein [Candidatus Acidoferrum sp.]